MLANIAHSKLPVEQFNTELRDICGAFQTQATEQQTEHRGALQVEERFGLEFAHVATDIHAIRRSNRDVRQDDGENFFLIFQEEGRALMSQNDTTCMLQPGDMILIDSAKPSEFTFFGKFQRQLSLHLPRQEMSKRFGELIHGGKFLTQNDQTAQALSAVVSKAFAHNSNETQSNYLREALFGLIGAMLFEQASDPNAAGIDADVSGAQTLKGGLNFIDQCFSNNELTIPQVADHLGTSMRQLQRSFALIGTTPTDYLIQKRLEHACQLLLARHSKPGTQLVSTIAYASGFNDVSYFNRQFRRAFGCAPGQF
ncbi:helix-turn-helix domain-containing protein [Parasedimentitalea huanghaiensis]|uniref:Helix-turn-helix domain-containing protein n=1 Tax=Parasedimentitalea huanghaiensis TaxID=2682100 RepID=A0A6L6WKT6_9RHOB|nr:helix-turn-helix domain-containing protein [Zongyanglinia huanghaiensis]MVO16637.1 helix-turn-helix domain-containing protein [Zongyanglinia huanghaiensis]